jgi:hypothetical protein
MFLHVGAAAIMVKGFTSLSQLAVGKVMQPQVSFIWHTLGIELTE